MDFVEVTLREAIEAANGNPGEDRISFDIPGAGPHTIRPASPMPEIREALVLDATTQPGYGTDPQVEIDGSLLGPGSVGLVLLGSGSTVRGFALNRIEWAGVILAGDGIHTVQANRLGTDPAGLIALGIGDGIYVQSSSNLIGGSNPHEGNVIAGHRDRGIVLIGSSARQNRILGNLIGTDRTGSVALKPDSMRGVMLLQDADENRVGGAQPGQRNIISGLNVGIDIRSSSNVIEGNFLGVTGSGNAVLPNNIGIGFWDAGSGNLVGGAAPGSGNLISGNNGPAIQLNAPGGQGTVIRGNLIGTDLSGVKPMANWAGIEILGAARILVGGEQPGQGNVIAHNTYCGVLIHQGVAAATGISIRGNSIHSNRAGGNAPGIDLGSDGYTANDHGDGDAGPNHYQNFPELTEALASRTTLTVRGTVDSQPGGTYTLDFYLNDVAGDACYGEGRLYVGSSTVVADHRGQGDFTCDLPVAVESGHITATATDGEGNSSEFSPCVAILPGWPKVISAQTFGNPRAVTVSFSRPLDTLSARHIANYTISPNVEVESVTLLNSMTVRLNTTLIAEGRVYRLDISGLIDVDGRTDLAGSQVEFLQTHGGITRFEYHGIPGSTVADLRSSPRFPQEPDRVEFTPLLEGRTDVADHYGVAFRGFVTAPSSGEYTFYLASDDQGELWLSSDAEPAHKVLIAREPAWSSERSWLSGPTQHLRLPPPSGIYDGALFIEAEDFDFDGGKFVVDQPIGVNGPYSGRAYFGLGAIAEIDYHDPGSNESPIFRPASQGVATAAISERNRGLYDVEINHVVGWNSEGDWFNYTRRFPEPWQSYHVYARVSSGGADIAVGLEEVVEGAGSPNQTTVKRGEFRAPSPRDWSTYHLVPLLDDSGALAAVPLGGQRTLRLVIMPGDCNIDYLLFKPSVSDLTTLSDFKPLNQSPPVSLIAGAKYYFEALMKEATGGDHLAVAWRRPGDPIPTNGAPPIPGMYLSGFTTLEPVQITRQPQAVTTVEFGAATFSVGVNGSAPISYQWFKDDLALTGANEPTFRIERVSYVDNGARIAVMVANGISSVRSQEVVLTVHPDIEPPTITLARGNPSLDRVLLRFSEALSWDDAGDPANYIAGAGLAVLGAEPSLDGHGVVC